jgi:hypothetical protein
MTEITVIINKLARSASAPIIISECAVQSDLDSTMSNQSTDSNKIHNMLAGKFYTFF